MKFGQVLLGIIVFIFLLFFCYGLSRGCVDPGTALRVLTDNGYTDVKFTGYSLFACGEDDFYHTGFVARSSTGHVVEGTVCSGMFFKNSTIRFK